MYSNSLARHFSSMFHAKCLLPRLDKLLQLRSCLQNFYQCMVEICPLTGDPSKNKSAPKWQKQMHSFSHYSCQKHLKYILIKGKP